MLKPLLSILIIFCVISAAHAQQKRINDTLVVDSNQALHYIKSVNDTVMPRYKGGNRSFAMFVKRHLQYPAIAQEKKISGYVKVSFTVEVNGEITGVKVVKGLGYGCDEEAVRIMNKSPRWHPAYKNGQTIAIQFEVFIYFGKPQERVLKFPSADTQMVYMKFPNQYVTDAQQADFVMFVYPSNKTDKTIYPIKEFFADGKIKYAGNWKYKKESTIPFGQCVEFYQNGRKKMVSNFDDLGRLTGYQYNFYPNGRLYTEKFYDAGNSDLITCKDSLGNVLAEHGKGSWIVFDDTFKKQTAYGFVKGYKRDGQWVFWTTDDIKVIEDFKDGKSTGKETYYKIEGGFYSMNEIPMYKKNFDALYQFLSDNVKYPSKARKNNINGSVGVSITVKPDGSFLELKILKSLGFDCDEEAIRVIQASGPWTPATVLKYPIRFYLNVYFSPKYYYTSPGYVPLVGNGITTRFDGIPKFYN